MSRHIKLAIAAVATTVVATLGVTGVAPSAAPGDGPSYKDRSYCC